MKEAKDLLQDLKNALDEAASLVEDIDNFEGKQDVLVAIDTAYNEISAALHDLS